MLHIEIGEICAATRKANTERCAGHDHTIVTPKTVSAEVSPTLFEAVMLMLRAPATKPIPTLKMPSTGFMVDPFMSRLTMLLSQVPSTIMGEDNVESGDGAVIIGFSGNGGITTSFGGKLLIAVILQALMQ